MHRRLLAEDVLDRPAQGPSNARHYRLVVRGKSGREREVPVPLAVQQALEAWLKVHPLARGVGLLDEQPLFVRLGCHGHEQPLALSAVGAHRLVRRAFAAAGLPGRLAYPHALCAYTGRRCGCGHEHVEPPSGAVRGLYDIAGLDALETHPRATIISDAP
jgi:hypothetical protein